MNQNNKDPKKPTEEELMKLLEELKKNQKKKSKKLSLAFGFLLHKNYLIHLALSYGVNLVLFAVIIGLTTGINQPLLDINLPGFFLGITLFTLVENFIKILMFRYFLRFMILSLGLFSLLLQIIVLVIIDYYTYGFTFSGVTEIIVFAFIFSIFRLIAAIYLRRILYGEYVTFIGGK